MNRKKNRQIWDKLALHAEVLKTVHLNDLFNANANRFRQLSFQLDNHLFDFSKNFLTEETLGLFDELAQSLDLSKQIDHLFQGKTCAMGNNPIGLHTALRCQENKELLIDGHNLTQEIRQELKHMKVFIDQVLTGHWRGFSNKIITDVINIGIGGSYLGPLLLTETLTSYRTRLKVHFISSADGIHSFQLTRQLNPETTLFIIVSKTFTTKETLINANHLLKWFNEATGRSPFERHVIGVSANAALMHSFGIPKDNQFYLWDCIGGRFSIWSTVGLVSALAIGFEHFSQFLLGGYLVDQHFRKTDFKHNIPCILALLDFFYIQYWNTQTHAILPYHSYLRQFPAYLQQLSMESLGKSVTRAAKAIDYPTGNIIWGELGSNGQHAFFQLLHQGKLFIPIDLLVPMHLEHQQVEFTRFILANALAQSQALMQGKSREAVYQEMLLANFSVEEIKQLLPHRIYPGNRPSTTILLANLTPKTLGQILAIYEHKIFVQSVIWNINPFDQWGVELGKELADKYLHCLQNDEKKIDDETINYIKNFLNSR
ncbi:MAG: glucose-6-phosphate isomerase [Tatlockia sp.]